MVTDHLGRRFRKLRLSLTQRCNFACYYCVPEGEKLVANANELSPKEMVKAVRYLVIAGGIEEVRITGGEPLLYRGLEELLEELQKLSLKRVSITSNAVLLSKKASLLKKYNVDRVNVSLDSLDEERFREITRGGKLSQVLKGIEAAVDEGLIMKLNMIPMKGINDDEILSVLDYCFDRNIVCRYIELMKMGPMVHGFGKRYVSMGEVLSKIQTKYSFHQVPTEIDSTAIRYEVPNRGRFGIIANESQPFCKTCSRLRLTSEGDLMGCLSSVKKEPIREILKMEEEEAVQALQPLLRNTLAVKQEFSFTGAATIMKSVGG